MTKLVALLVVAGVVLWEILRPPVPPAGSRTLLIEQPPPGLATPLDRSHERVTKKRFGQLVSDRFSGYHTGVDFEIFPEELNQDVAVKAVCSGDLKRKEWAAGYGGVVIQNCQLNNQPVTIIYGHLKLDSVTENYFAVGNIVGILGKAESMETDGERKHLHLGIHKGTKINIAGYVGSVANLSTWLDPCLYNVCGKN